MAVPTYEELMLPILRLAANREEHRYAAALTSVCNSMGLTDSDRNETIPSGQTRVYNRFGWAITHLSQARLLEKPGRGRFKITERGLDLLKEELDRVDNNVLSRFPEFLEFRARRKATVTGSGSSNTLELLDTPEERLDDAYQELRAALASDLLDRVLAASPKFFEHLVIDLLVAMGYGGSRADAAQVAGRPGDGGIDGTIKEDKLGLDIIYVQAKRWEGTVGRPAIQSFVGSLDGEKAVKGVFITTSTFSEDAREYVRRVQKKIVLIDGTQLAQLMIDHGVGVTVAKQITVCRPDSDYFEEAE